MIGAAAALDVRLQPPRALSKSNPEMPHLPADSGPRAPAFGDMGDT
jgi:hypothetical protein